MGTMVETEMDQFIRNHKQNLQTERNDLDDRVRYAGGPQVTSPSNRKQWDRGRAQETKPAEEMRPPQQPADLRLQLGNDDLYEDKKKKLQLERQKEYNELMNKKGPGRKRRPRTPANDGLPLGNHTEQRKALDKERNEEMKAAMSQSETPLTKAQGGVFDYEATKRSHMDEKRKEYNQYLDQMKSRSSRHIATPEDGMFVGQDQKDRNKYIRDKNLKHKQALEQQWMDQLTHKALLEGEIAQVTPRNVNESPRRNPNVQINDGPSVPNVPKLKLTDDKEYQVEERVMEMPKVTPRQVLAEQYQFEPKPRQQTRSEQKGREPNNIWGQGYNRNQKVGFADEKDQVRGRDYDEGQGRISDRGQGHKRSRSYERDGDPGRFGEGLERFQWQSPRRNLPSFKEVRRSRSMSPVRDRPPVDHEERKRQLEDLLNEYDKSVPPGKYYKESQPPQEYTVQNTQNQELGYQSQRSIRQEQAKQMYEEQMAQKQQKLRQEYERETAEAQRIANEQGTSFEQQEYQNKHRQLEEEKKREYQEYLAEHPTAKFNLRKKEVTPENLRIGLPLDQSKYDVQRQQLQTARKEEYNEILHKEHLNRHWKSPEAETFLENFGKLDPTKERLVEDRKDEYREILKKQRAQRREMPVGTGATLPVGEYSDTRKQELFNERQKEYQQLQQEKQLTDRRRGLPPKPPTPNHFFKNLGQHDRQIEALNEERKKEYNQKLTDKNYRSGGRNAPSNPNAGGTLALGGTDSAEGPQEDLYATLPGLHYSESPEIRKMKARNNEYNDFLQDKKHKDAHRFDSKKPPSERRHSNPSSPRGRGTKGTLPGLNYSDSADKRKMQERNREYNDFLKQKQNRKTGWSTPTYEEILEQKRRDESIRRQDEVEPSRMRSFHSEGALNRLEDNLRARELDKEFEARKVRFDDERNIANGILEDDNWLKPERREEQYQNLTEPPPPPIREDMTAVRQPYNSTLMVGHDERNSAQMRRKKSYAKELQLQMEDNRAARTRERRQELQVNASGLLDPAQSSYRLKGIGGDQIVSPRREYKANDVQRYHSKFLEDDGDEYDALGRRTKDYLQTTEYTPKTDFGGKGLGFGSGLGLSGLGSEGYNEGYQPSSYNGPGPTRGILTNSGDSLQLNLGGGGHERGRRRDRDVGIFDTGITGLLEQRRNVGVINPPPGLMYQPSTYVTGGGGGLYGQADEAYHYYATKNPLDVDVGSGVPGLNLGGDYGGRRGSPTRVTFREPDSPLPYFDRAGEDRSHRKRDRSKERISPYQFPSDDDNRSRSRQDTLSYGAELERQIQEKRVKKQMERQEQDRYERKLEEDIKNYNPFGRGGGGAPIKDGSGNAIADLRSINRGNQSDRSPPRQQQQFQPSGSFSPRPPSPRDDKIRPPPAQHNAVGDATYARGGHGIFGQPKTEAEKDVTDKYKDELRQQIADKRRREQMEKDREKAEEDKENRRLEEQRIRMQSEYDEEQKKVRSREEEARKKNEELRNLAEEKKKDSERKKREVDDTRMKEQQEQIERERQEKQRAAQEDRMKSPPVPAIKVQMYNPSHTSEHNHYSYTYQTEEKRSKSPPLPAHRKERDSPRATSRASRTSSRAQQSPAPGPSIQRQNSSDVLTQLASMRKQLQSERRRVEQALEDSQNTPDVFDPRTIQRPPPNKLVFENAMNKNASLPPPRAQTSDMANARNIQQFNELKFKSDSDSRRAFRSMFPEAPVTNNTLEAQQDAMLRQQEDYLRNLRDKIGDDVLVKVGTDSVSEDPFENPTSLGYGRHGNSSARSQLAANSAFIDVDGVNHFPEDFEDMAGMRNDSARARRRDRFSPRIPSVNGMGSNSSLDVDRIQMKNEERLRKLQQMTTGDEVSMGDPDDILERFMAKQRYNRPPSGQTLQDDTWLRPGSKVV